MQHVGKQLAECRCIGATRRDRKNQTPRTRTRSPADSPSVSQPLRLRRIRDGRAGSLSVSYASVTRSNTTSA
jgi:hypothetical protein